MRRKIISLVLFISMLLTGIGAEGIITHSAEGNMETWTQSSFVKVFQDDTKTTSSTTEIDIIAAKNEYESEQIIIRNSQEFTIDDVVFSNLTSGSNVIDASNIRYNFVEYHTLTNNSRNYDKDALIRLVPSGGMKFPDALSNEETWSVEANKAQPIWITVYVPTSSSAGNYTGTATVSTSTVGVKANHIVNIRVEVANVTIPDPSDGAFTLNLWTSLNGHYGRQHDMLTPFYDWDDPTTSEIEGRYSSKWWELIDFTTDMMKEHRMNAIMLSPTTLLADGGSYKNAQGNWVFNWSRFDEYVQHYLDKGMVKYLYGHGMQKANNLNAWMLIPDPNLPAGENADEPGEYIAGSGVSYKTTEGDKWYRQYIKALVTHLTEKGWLNKWWQSIVDEPSSYQRKELYKYTIGLFKEEMTRQGVSGIKFGDAYYSYDVAAFIEQANVNVDIHIPLTSIAENQNNDSHKMFYENTAANANKDVFYYNMAEVPAYMYLNRMIDNPPWTMRTLSWLSYYRDVNGFLYWAWNRWTEPDNPQAQPYEPDDRPHKGGEWSVYTDVSNNKIKSSIKFDDHRDGVEDFELFKIAETHDQEAAKALARSIVGHGRNYCMEPQLLKAKKRELVKLAAGTPLNAPASETVNYALYGRTSSSSQSSSITGEDVFACDGKMETAWIAKTNVYPQYLKVGFGEIEYINKIDLEFDNPTTTYRYKVETSVDGSNYATAVDKSSNTEVGSSFTHVVTSREARYVKVTILGIAAGIQASIKELRTFYNPSLVPDDTPPDPTVPVGSTIWIRSVETGKYLTVDTSTLQIKSNKTTIDSWEQFVVEDAGNGWIRLRANNGKYIRAIAGSPQSTCDANGELGEWAQWKWVNMGNGIMRLESRVNTDSHMRVNVSSDLKEVDNSGGTGSWAQFTWGQ